MKPENFQRNCQLRRQEFRGSAGRSRSRLRRSSKFPSLSFFCPCLVAPLPVVRKAMSFQTSSRLASFQSISPLAQGVQIPVSFFTPLAKPLTVLGNEGDVQHLLHSNFIQINGEWNWRIVFSRRRSGDRQESTYTATFRLAEVQDRIGSVSTSPAQRIYSVLQCFNDLNS